MSSQLRGRPLIARLALAYLLALTTLATTLGPASTAARAETYAPACSAPALIQAIDDANATPEASRIELPPGCTISLTADHNSADGTGSNGLPVIAAGGGPLTITGNGAVIERDTAAVPFRVFQVASGASLTLADLTLRNGNSFDADGGAILNLGDLLLVGVTLHNNRTGIDGASGYGGALANLGSATIRQSAVIDNVAGDDGGGIYHNGGVLSIASTTIARNSANGSPGIGGGIMALDASVTLNNVTVTGNTAIGSGSAGGGIYTFNSGSYTVNNSIIAGNTSEINPNCSAAIAPGSANNVEGPGGNCPGFLTGSPELALDESLRFYTLGAASAARGSGAIISCAPADQRGLPRRADATCDSGAVEFGDGAATIDFNEEGLTGLSGASAESALNATYVARGVIFDAYRADLFNQLDTDGAAVGVYSDPNGADILVNFDYPVAAAQIVYTQTNGANSIITARNSVGTAATIEGAGALIVNTDSRTTPGVGAVAGQCIRSLQIENASAAFRFDNLTFTPQTGVDADNNGIVDQCDPNSLVVTNTNNASPGSLRQAILDANAAPDASLIRFDIPGDGLRTIGLSTPLPVITTPTTIDGYSQPGASPNTQSQDGVVQVALGGNATVGVGLRFAAGAEGSEVRGLRLSQFTGDAITISTNAVRVSGNLIANNSGAGVVVDGGSGGSILGNRIFENAGGAISLLNGANNGQAAPTITTAIPGYPAAGKSNVQGWLLSGEANTAYTVQLFGGTSCAPGGAAEARTLLDSFSAATGPDGTAALTRTLNLSLPAASYVSATATGPAGNSSALASCAPVGPDNTVWYQAVPLNGAGAPVRQPIALSEQVRWYYVELGTRSRLAVNLSDLPAGYDVALFNDLNARAAELVAGAAQDLPATLAVAQTQINYDQIESSNFITNSLAPELYSPEAYTARALAPATFRPDVLADAVVSPFKASPFKASPFKASPFKASPFKASPFKASPFKASPFKASDLAGLVIDTGLLAYTDIEGTGPRTLTLASYNESGRVYIAVYGRNGAFDPAQPFTLTAASTSSACATLGAPPASVVGLRPQAGSFKTIFLTDFARLPGTAAEKEQLRALIASFNARPEVGGVLVDVALDARVAAANALADANDDCPEAKNLVAAEIKGLIERYRASSPALRYIVLGGGDEVIPFFRYPDQALLGNESEFKPPVRNGSSSEAALRLGYILGQDEYGARYTVSFRTTTLAIPDLPVGRLVETAGEVMAMLNRYIADNGLITPARSFVSGYDFHYESATEISRTLRLGTARPVDALLSPSTESYQAPGTWTADELRAALTTGDYDLLYLAGHFSDGALKAADYASVLRAAQLETATTQLYGALVVSPGCHSGFNTPDGAAVAGATDQPDWAQFFARRGTTLVAGTGYQYGDTQFTQFAEELYVRLFEQLRIDAVPNSPLGDAVPIGDALVVAKQRYLLDSAVIRGIDKKTLSISTLFGLPMTRVNMLGARLSPQRPPDLPAVLGPLTPIGQPGDGFALQVVDTEVTPELFEEALSLNTLSTDQPRTATYVRGPAPDDLIARPAEPVQPFVQYSVGRDGQQLRGALFLSGSYTERRNILPLTGAPATELRGVHMTFPTEAYYPEKWWGVNYLGALTGEAGPGATRLQLTPSQFLADPGSSTGTLRYYNQPLGFRLFYSSQEAAGADGVNPALYGAPAIPAVQFTREGALVRVAVSANGGGVPLRELWLTFTADAGPLDNRWQSIRLAPSADDPTRYEGSYPMPEGTRGFSFFVQAVNAAGFTALNTNLGLYYQAGGLVGGLVVPPPPSPVPPVLDGALATSLSLTLPTGATYGKPATFGVQLSTDADASLAGKPLTFSVGSQTATALTGADGRASFTLTLFGSGAQPVAVSFTGGGSLRPAEARATLVIAKQQPLLVATPATLSMVQGTSATLGATLTDADGGVRDARLYLSVGGAVRSALTGPEGRASLPVPALAPGSYPYSVTYLRVPTTSGPLAESDPRYLPATAAGTLVVTFPPPAVTTAAVAPVDIIVSVASGVSIEAVLRGTVNANGAASTVRFEIRRESAASFTPIPVAQTIGGALATPVSATATGLAENTTYVARLVAQNSGGTAVGNEVRFTTPNIGATAVRVTPVLECVTDRGARVAQRYEALFGYSNSNSFSVRVLVGADNRFTPNPRDRGQPTLFAPGRSQGAFRVPFTSGNQVWLLTGKTSTAAPNSSRCR